MSSGLLSLYMNVGYNYCVQKVPHFPEFRQCGRRNESGLLACGRKASKGLEGAFCSYGCEADHYGGSIRVPSPLREDAPLVSREVSADRSGVRHREDAEQDVLSMHREGARAEAVSADSSSALRRRRSRSRSRRQTLAFFLYTQCMCLYLYVHFMCICALRVLCLKISHMCTLHARCREVNDSRLAITSGEGPLFILGRRYVLEWSVYPG